MKERKWNVLPKCWSFRAASDAITQTLHGDGEHFNRLADFIVIFFLGTTLIQSCPENTLSDAGLSQVYVKREEQSSGLNDKNALTFQAVANLI